MTNKLLYFDSWLSAAVAQDSNFPTQDFATGEDGVLRGTVVTYEDDVAEFFGIKLTIASGALEMDETIINRQHDRSLPMIRLPDPGLQFADDGKTLRMAMKWPETSTIASDTRDMVERKILRGLSLEFFVNEEKFNHEERKLTVLNATVRGIGIVDRPAFAQSTIDARMFDAMQSGGGELWKPPPPPRRRMVIL